MKEIMIKGITSNNFNKFGKVIEYPGLSSKNKNKNLFRIILEDRKARGWRIAYLVVRDKSIDRLEQHPGTFESFEPIKGNAVLFVASRKNLSEIEKFRLNKPVILKKGLWHGVVTKGKS
ncbi:MAG: hypothetical protein NTY47_04245, partial [Candidatus Omnitrophica bacterium]|nr:hypothetical protein [Candidatus Omnitrophota bacterium]